MDIETRDPQDRRLLVFAEHTPSSAEVDQVLGALEPHRGARVTVVLHHDPGPHEPVREHGGTTHDHLEQLLDVLGAAGHEVAGDLVSGDVEHALLTEIRVRAADRVVLLPGRHLLAHLAHRDLEHRLRHHTHVPVHTIVGHTVPHLV